MKQVMNVLELKPSVCVWELTLACNLRCGHCGSRAGLARADELSLEECLTTVADLALLGCEVITLSGGEPTLKAGWADIAQGIRDHGMLCNLVTNGTTLDGGMARLMKSAGLTNVAISIDGPREIHDRLRGTGTFHKSCRALSLLREVGMPTTVMTTLQTINLDHLEEIHNLAVSLGAQAFRTQLGKPMGNLKDHADQVLRPRDLLAIMPKLARLSLRGQLRVGIGDSLGYFGPHDTPLRATTWKGEPQAWRGCQAGLRAIGIESNGGVKGCLSMQSHRDGPDPFLEGNLRKRSLEDIWRDPNAFSYNRRFDPKSLTGACARCEHKERCRGGAHCVAAATTGSLSEDPFCTHRLAMLESERQNSSKLKRHLATAASLATLLVAGCGSDKPTDPCANANCGDPKLSAELVEQCCTSTEYGVEPPCEMVSCETPDPTTQVATFEECCGVIDCDDACCECDYGVLPPMTIKKCC